MYFPFLQHPFFPGLMTLYYYCASHQRSAERELLYRRAKSVLLASLEGAICGEDSCGDLC